MPRDRFDDPDTRGLYVQVNCRPTDGPEDPGPGFLQISTHDERPDSRVVELLGTAGEIMAALHSAATCKEDVSAELAERLRAWTDEVVEFNAELTGTYVTLTRQTTKGIIKALHRGANKVWPPQNLVVGALDGLELPGPPG